VRTDAAGSSSDPQSELDDLRARVASAQQLANMGDYDWHIASDTLTWSDQLFRIYGFEPGSFDPSYERFVSSVHPEDREHVQSIHRSAMTTGEPYRMTERIVRPDGEVRFLATNGEVVHDGDGNPVRMRGTCIDITDRVEAERDRQVHEATARAERSRRQAALEINDTVVQGLTAALYALEVDDDGVARHYLEQTLEAARQVITDLGTPLDGSHVSPGDLLRSSASTVSRHRFSG
jgi:PAS domain S-box-containing protein